MTAAFRGLLSAGCTGNCGQGSQCCDCPRGAQVRAPGDPTKFWRDHSDDSQVLAAIDALTLPQSIPGRAWFAASEVARTAWPEWVTSATPQAAGMRAARCLSRLKAAGLVRFDRGAPLYDIPLWQSVPGSPR